MPPNRIDVFALQVPSDSHVCMCACLCISVWLLSIDASRSCRLVM